MSTPSTGEIRVPLERRALRDRVYDLILAMLTSGDVQPGSKLSIDVVARELDVSPTPVREALVQLERTGLVSREAHRGYRVAAPLTVEQVLEVYDARVVVETGAMALVPRTEAFVAELVEAEERHHVTADAVLSSATVAPELLAEYFEADWEFHRVIFRHAGNRHLAEAAESLGTHMHRRRQTLALQENDVRLAVAEHDAIVEALQSSDPDAAVEALRTHIVRVRERALAAAQQESRSSD